MKLSKIYRITVEDKNIKECLKQFSLMQSAVDCEFEPLAELFTDRELVVCKKWDKEEK